MENFLREILKFTKFSTARPNREFLPRKVGLGYEWIGDGRTVDILKPVIREARKQKEKKYIKPKEQEPSSEEELSRMKHIEKKVRRK
ncbi:hypothetical protein ENBRE01_1170 [Enteropsectra breve]|nr:hypothetical protein ENBRE01_1170 [Enteropsectra breve]